jgi:hypothetical protein
LELIKNVCEYAKVTNTKEFLITLVEEEEKIDARKQKRMHLRINTFPIEEATKEQIYNEHTLSTLVANDLNTILQFIHERFPKQVAAFEQKLLEREVKHSNPLDLFLYVLTQYLALSQLLAETAETAENKQN